MPFPRPDNLLKLARSNQNAAHIGMCRSGSALKKVLKSSVGLFSPGRGGQGQLGPVRRFGVFDRGTPSAEAEELNNGNWLPRNGASLGQVEDIAARNLGKLHPFHFGVMTANGYQNNDTPSPGGYYGEGHSGRQGSYRDDHLDNYGEGHSGHRLTRGLTNFMENHHIFNRRSEH